MHIKKLLVLLVVSLLSITAYAGYTQPAPVMIEFYPADFFGPGSPAGGAAGGDMNSARNSKNKNEFIGCGVRLTDDGAGGTFSFGFCQANADSDAGAGEPDVFCAVLDSELIEGMRAIADSSYITFRWKDDGTGNLTCTRIGTSTQSFYLLKGRLNN